MTNERLIGGPGVSRFDLRVPFIVVVVVVRTADKRRAQAIERLAIAAAHEQVRSSIVLVHVFAKAKWIVATAARDAIAIVATVGKLVVAVHLDVLDVVAAQVMMMLLLRIHMIARFLLLFC